MNWNAPAGGAPGSYLLYSRRGGIPIGLFAPRRLLWYGAALAAVWALLAAPLFAVVHVLASHAIEVARTACGIRLKAIASLGAYACDEDIGGVVRLAEAYAKMPEIQDFFGRRSRGGAETRLKDLVESNPEMEEALLTDSNGACLISYPEHPESVGAKVQVGSAPYVMRGHGGGPDPGAVLCVASRISSESRTAQGALVVHVRVGMLQRALQRALGDWGGGVLLADRNGEIASIGGDTAHIPAAYSPGSLVNRCLRSAFIETFAGPKGEDVIAASFAPALSGAVMAKRNLEESMEGTPALVRRMYAVCAGVALLLAAALLMLAERHRRVAALRLAEEGHRLLSERKSEFVSFLAHELQNPLTSIQGFAALLLGGVRGALPEPALRDLGTIRERARFMIELVNDLLDVSKIEAGRLEVRPQTVDLGEIVERALAAFEPIASERGVELKREASGAPLEVRADPRHVEQVLTNLVSNALKFSEKGAVSLRIERLSGECRLEVRDSGPGMTEDEQAKLFHRYSTLGSARGSRHRHTGLGLYLCRQLVELQGGRIWVESRPGEGTRVFFTLPAGPGAQPSA